MSFKCKECGDSFDSLKGLHSHLRKHSKLLGDYYVENYQRKGKLTGDLIPFKNYKRIPPGTKIAMSSSFAERLVLFFSFRFSGVSQLGPLDSGPPPRI